MSLKNLSSLKSVTNYVSTPQEVTELRCIDSLHPCQFNLENGHLIELTLIDPIGVITNVNILRNLFFDKQLSKIYIEVAQICLTKKNFKLLKYGKPIEIA